MLSLRILFFTLPLYFSHIFSGFGIVFGGGSSFERQKVYLMVILIGIALIEWLWRYPDAVVGLLRKYGIIVLILLVYPFFTQYWWGGGFDIQYWWGGIEKHHGYILYIAIILLTMIVSTASEKDKKQYIQVSIWSGGVVAIVAIYQYIGGSMISGRFPGRSISTLGNPNYLAGYLLLILPLIQRIRSPEKWIISSIIVLALLTTGSYIGMALFGCYLIYITISHLFRYISFGTPQLSILVRYFLFFIFCLLLLGLGYYFIDSQKFLSLTSRFILMRESLVIMFREPLSLLIGFGPDSLASHFSVARSALITSYFPSNEIIDSSHNIIIDILFQYGIFPLIVICHSLIRSWKNQKEDAQAAILLGIGFLLLNVFVVVHLILISLLISICPKESSRLYKDFLELL